MGEWILVDDRHIQRVGTGEPPEAELTIDLPGTTIVPGFIDSHVHLTATGRSLANADVRDATSKEELLALIGGARDRTAITVVHVEGFDETRWDARELPTAHELDAITPTPVVATRADGHISVVSASTLAAIDLADADGVEPDADRRPTGRLTKEANRRAIAWVEASYDTQRVEGFQLQAAGLAASRGRHGRPRDVPRTSPTSRCSWATGTGFRSTSLPRPPRCRLPDAMERDFRSIGGDLPVDGSIGARTAALSHPYEDGPDQGELYHDDDAMAEFFHAAHNAGLQVGVHAIGDRAIEQVLATWERVYLALDSRERRHFRARRHRIEHFVLPVRRARSSGPRCSGSPSPCSPRSTGSGDRVAGMYEERLGPAARDGRAPDPHDARPRDRGRRRLRLAGHAAGSDARDRRAGGAITSRPSDSRGSRRSSSTG